MTRRLLPLLALAALAACGSTASSSSSGGGGAPSGLPNPGGFQTPKPITISVDISLTSPKAVTAHYTATVGDAGTCQVFAKYGTDVPAAGDTPNPNQSFNLPQPNGALTFSDGNKGSIDPGSIDQYHGPDTYSFDGAALSNNGGGAVWLAPFAGDQEPGGAGQTSTLKITVHDDGSGESDFTGYEDPGSNTYAGKITWTCSA